MNTPDTLPDTDTLETDVLDAETPETDVPDVEDFPDPYAEKSDDAPPLTVFDRDASRAYRVENGAKPLTLPDANDDAGESQKPTATVVRRTITPDEALFGCDPTEGIVALEPGFDESATCYRRVSGQIVRERVPFRPWMLLAKRPSAPLPDCELSELEGDGLNLLAEFADQSAYQAARFRVRDEHIETLSYPSAAKMALVRSGQTLFKGMTFEDVVRMQFDIETDGLDPAPEPNRILLVAVSDNRGLCTLLEGDERDILEAFAALVRERDPDVLEGHNVFGFDFPYIFKRAERHGVRLTIGRDGSEPRLGQERNYAIAAGGNSRPFTPVYIHGRHVCDTYLVVQRFDWAKQALTSYGLKEAARVYGFAEEERVELPRGEMARIYREDPELVRIYARQDVIETQKLAALISPIEFYQTQMVPDNYGQVITTGNGEKINAIFVRAYLAAGRAIARTSTPRPYAGGYTEVREKGVLDHVVKADVESLYPSLMLTHRIAPQADSLGIFLPCLADLTARRIDAKRRAGATRDERQETGDDAVSVPLSPASRSPISPSYWDGLQGSFKVLINSFYGYLGGPFNWNDYDAAERVTNEGRTLVVDIANRMVASGSKVIEIDTDGVYFVPPAKITEGGEPEERAYVAEIGSALPEGIRLAFDGRFRTMLSLKTKNYVLVGYDGKKTFKGASLRSRADERYGRKFLASAVDCLLEHDFDGIAELYAKAIDDLLVHRIPIDELARRERVTEKTFNSENKKRSAAIAKNVAIGEHVFIYEKSDGTLALRESYAGDENVKYYMDKLYKFAKRLEEAFGGAFARYIPKPTAQGLPKQEQFSLDLF